MIRTATLLAQPAASPLSSILTAATDAALAAGGIIKDFYGRSFDIQHKGTIDLVTEADIAAEKAIIGVLRGAFPHAALLAEESHAEHAGKISGPTWIIDPLDGTTNFAHRFPWFAVSIAYADQGRIKAGVIYAPMLDELFVAGAGCGTWLNDTRVAVSSTTTLQNALLATGFPYDIRKHRDMVVGMLANVLPESRGVRRAGAAALDLAYVACGRLDGFWEIELKPWDTAAGILLLTEAGGRATDFSGATFSPFMRQIAASNSAIHDELLHTLLPPEK